MKQDQPAFASLGMIAVVIALAGCSSVLKDLPPGSNVQVSTTGVRLSPQAIDGPLILGQSTYSLQTPTPDDAGPGLNRNQVRAGLTGIEITSTVATGPVGEQLQQAGGPEALKQLLQSQIPSTPGGALESPLSDPDDSRAD
tara:strand:- start:21181 stop:21603 length:423 start_codon:yes stop_codon:yes gene_type:complete